MSYFYVLETYMEHTNFCRSLVKQYSALLDVPSMALMRRREMVHAIDLCLAAQKFMLPDGGKLLNDGELRGLDESEPLRLPHRFIALEYRANGGLRSSDHYRCTRRIVFAREADYGILINIAFCGDADGQWNFTDECFVASTGYLDRSRADASGAPWINFLRPPVGDINDYLEEVSTMLSFLSALQCANVTVERSDHKKADRKIKAALGFDSYHVLTIDVPSKPGQSIGFGGPHRSPREHLRRGHIRRLADGRRIWVNATVVAAKRGAGSVTKDYAIRSAA